MIRLAERYVIREYDSFTYNEKSKAVNLIHISEKLFNALETFILENKSNSSDALELLSVGSKKGVGKIISAKNYVGVICMNDGTTIEILPKIFNSIDDNYGRVRSILLEMLRHATNIPVKVFNHATLKTEHTNIYEIFISMFIEEVTILYKRGLKSGYIEKRENVSFCKGHILFSEQIKHNYIHKEKFFVEYDSFEINRSENRLIKSTLRYLLGMTQDKKNKQDICRLINMFSDIDESVNIDFDFSNTKIDRNMQLYEKIMQWCRVFLKKESFTSFYGSTISNAILFPMDKVFESYVAYMFSKFIDRKQYCCTAQDRGYYLFEVPKKKFRLRPDIVLRNKQACEHQLIIDTKWKLLLDEKRNFGISQSDMYQMYAYGKKYNTEHIVLLYPENGVHDNEIEYVSNDNIYVKICFIDLSNPKASIIDIINWYYKLLNENSKKKEYTV